MDGMVVVVLAVVAVALGVVLARLGRRASTDELHSVERYHDALGTIETITHRTERPAIRILGRPGEDGGQVAPPDDLIPGAPTGAGPGAPGAGAGVPLVFDDAGAGQAADGATGTSGAPSAAFRSDRTRRNALTTMNRRSRSMAPVAAAIAAVVVIGALALIGSRAAGHRTSRTTATTRPRAVHPTGTTVPSTTTTAPAQVVATSSTAQAATFPVASATYRVTVTAGAGPSWVQATSASSGSVLFTGTIPSNQAQTIDATGTVSVLIGAPANLQVDGVPVVMPTGSHTPFTATFVPQGSAPPAPGTSTTSPTTTVPPTTAPPTTAPPTTTVPPASATTSPAGTGSGAGG